MSVDIALWWCIFSNKFSIKWTRLIRWYSKPDALEHLELWDPREVAPLAQFSLSISLSIFFPRNFLLFRILPNSHQKGLLGVQGVRAHRSATSNPTLQFCLSWSSLYIRKFCLWGNLLWAWLGLSYPHRNQYRHGEWRCKTEERVQISVGNISSALNLTTLQRCKYR